VRVQLSAEKLALNREYQSLKKEIRKIETIRRNNR
jgi:hypothetical protein